MVSDPVRHTHLKDAALVVPTKGSHPALLSELIESSGIDRAKVVIIRTDPAAPAPADCCLLDDFGPINIQRWWISGIEQAITLGARFVCVANDDVHLEANGIQTLIRHCWAYKAAIATPGQRLRLYRDLFPVQRRLDGALWVLDTASGLRPDPTYRWSYGDDDLDLKARRHFGGVVTVPIGFRHVHLNQQTSASYDLLELSRTDEALFRRRHRFVWAARLPRRTVRIARLRLRK